MATLKELRQTIRSQEDYIQELEDKLSEISGIAEISDVGSEDSDEDTEDD